CNIPACEVQVVDTTGAGDTFIGYYLAAKLENQSIEQCLRYASQAAALCVSRKGAQDSIPWKAEVLES
ncbi:PfkB family carbohydrate kinase, partial [Streptomyces caeruleatus]